MPAQGLPLRRLFSTFAHGWPGAGLLLMRLVIGVALIANGITSLQARPTIEPVILFVLAGCSGLCLLAGLWTPIAGTLVVIVEVWTVFSRSEDPWVCILLATLGAALAMLGPGGFSADALLFGWKRIDLQDRKL